MWISKKKWQDLEKRIADLEKKVTNLQEFFQNHLEIHSEENAVFKSVIDETKKNMIDSILTIQDEIVRQVLQTLNH